MRPSTTCCCQGEPTLAVWSMPHWCAAGSTRSGAPAPRPGAAAAVSAAAGCISASSRCWPSSCGSATTTCRGEPMLITFSGLDGAGKSTLVRWLQQTLERQHRRVVVFHMNDHVGVYAYLRRLRNQLGGAPPPPLLGTGGAGTLHRARKRDYPVEYLRDRWLAYRTVFPWVRGALVIKNDDLHAAQQAVARLVGERLAA